MFKQFKVIIKNETSNRIQYFWADNGKGEFSLAFQDILKSFSIQLKASPPYKYLMNGVVKRAIQTINKIAQSLIYVVKLLVKMWDYAINHVVYLKNWHPMSRSR